MYSFHRAICVNFVGWKSAIMPKPKICCLFCLFVCLFVYFFNCSGGSIWADQLGPALFVFQESRQAGMKKRCTSVSSNGNDKKQHKTLRNWKLPTHFLKKQKQNRRYQKQQKKPSLLTFSVIYSKKVASPSFSFLCSFFVSSLFLSLSFFS